jgi:formate-dependent nitrite reductase cytochrome c552 subunit
VKPVTNTSALLCGGCHTDQYRGLATINLNSPAKEEKGTPGSMAPMLDKLLAGHGFTYEHDEPRSHVFMVTDHMTVDRAYGGRFELNSWQDITSGGSVWDILTDNGASFTAPGTAKAANPVCLSCKSSDQILEWAYLGNENAKADWARTSVVGDFAKSITSPSMACIMCHDPHTTKPRIIRDALIETASKNGTYPNLEDDGASRATLNVTTFRDYRKIAELDKANANVLCAQCHVEYSCNPGNNTVTGEKITMTDTRTNQFPWVDVFGIEAHYDKLQFADFTHAVTGANLVKLQHPDVETNFGGTHQLNGVTCADCHMPKMVNSNGDTYTSHWQASPRNFLDKTCLKCHTDITAEEAEYRIDAIQNYTRGKVRDAEYWLVRLVDTFSLAKAEGVSEAVLNEARGYHETAHIYWEWWTAENSGGFHNVDMAKRSLALSVEAAKKGIAVLEKAVQG